MVRGTSPICSIADWACWAVALGGGDFQMAAMLGGDRPVLEMALAQGGVAVPLGVCLGGLWRVGVCLVSGAIVFSGIVPMVVGARDSALVARNLVILRR